MKTSAKRILASSLFVFFFFTQISTSVFAGNGTATVGNPVGQVPTSGTPTGITPTNSCGVTDQQVADYLSKFGYQVRSLAPANDGTQCDEIATTQYPYHTLVYISGGQITGHEDLPY